MEVATGEPGNGSGYTSNGVMYASATWADYAFGTQVAGTAQSNDMLKGLATGTTVRTRIGNKIRAAYIKGAFTFSAAKTKYGGISQGGERDLDNSTPMMGESFLRTTYRFVVVKDVQVNSTDTQVTWAQVFETNGLQAGVHSELNVNNMGRFIVLEDKVVTVDADDPQKTVTFAVSGSRVGGVRYNGPGADALTDKGIYVIFAAFVGGYWKSTLDDIFLPGPIGHSRLCFTDA